MTENEAVTGIEKGRYEVPLDWNRSVTEGIYAWVDDMQLRLLTPPGCGRPRHAAGAQLPAPDHAPLRSSQVGRPKVGRFVPRGGRKFPRFTHPPSVPQTL